MAIRTSNLIAQRALIEAMLGQLRTYIAQLDDLRDETRAAFDEVSSLDSLMGSKADVLQSRRQVLLDQFTDIAEKLARHERELLAALVILDQADQQAVAMIASLYDQFRQIH